MALLNGQSMGPKFDVHQSLELVDAYWQLQVGLKAQIGPQTDSFRQPDLRS